MKPFILQFAELPNSKPLDYSPIEYNETLNLSVLKGTKTPAIEYMDMGTTTFSKGDDEGTDADNQSLSTLINTTTDTHQHAQESSDSDDDIRSLYDLITTTTLTEAEEVTDQDR